MEERVGVITHYFAKIGVAAMTLENELRVGDTIRVKGHTSDFTQKVESIQKEHESVPRAGKGEEVGIRVKDHTREHDVVYRVVEG